MPALRCWQLWARHAARRKNPPSGARSPLVSADVLDRVVGAWLWTRAMQSEGRLVITIDGRTVRSTKQERKAPHLVAALAHGIGTVLGQVAVDEKPNEIPAVRELLKAFASLAARSSRSTRCTPSMTPRRPSLPGRRTT